MYLGGFVGRMNDHACSVLRSYAPIAAALCVAVTGCASVVKSGAPTAAAVPTGAAVPTAVVSAFPSGTSPASLVAPGAGVPQLLVLGNASNEEAGLWIYADDGTWTRGAKAAGVTAIARDGKKVTLASRSSLEFRDLSTPQDRGSSLSVNWSPRVPLGTVASVDTSDSGKAIVAIVDADGLSFAVVSGDGAGRLLTPAPASPFGPSVAWLDESTVVALSVDNRQISRLAAIYPAKGTVSLLQGLTGVRAFAVSPDRKTLAATTESGVYVAPVSEWLAGRVPASVATLKPSQVVWDVALSGDGSRVAMLSGTESPDGTVGDIHEIGYGWKQGEWAPLCNSPVPFDQVRGQVWLE
jgi:hypothetical protein